MKLRSLLIFALHAAIVSPILSAEATQGRLFTSILPQKYLVQRIAGPEFEVEALVGPGQSPATYEPGPRTMARLNEARALFPIGVPFEAAWLPKIRGSMRQLRIIDTVEAGAAHVHCEGHDHGEGLDPHLWTSPMEVIGMLPAIRDGLSALVPQLGTGFAERARLLEADLLALDLEIHGLFEGREGRRFMVFHPAWGHFAERYGLVQIAIEAEGKEPGARSLAAIIDRARELGIDTIFVQRQFSSDAAEAVAKATGAKIVVLDPLAEDYPENLLRSARLIAEALR